MIDDVATLRSTEVGDTPFRVTLTEEEILDVIGHRLASATGFAVTNLAVTLLPDSVKAQGQVALAGVPLQGQLTGMPRLEEGAVRFDVQSIDFNGSPAPGFIRNQIATRINERLSPDRLPVIVEGIELGQGAVTVSGRTK